MSFIQNFIKSRIVSFSYDLPKVMANMTKGGFKDYEEFFDEKQSMKFQECKFYSVLARNFRVTLFVNDAEKIKYEECLEQFKKFDELKSFLINMQSFYWQLSVLYLDVTKTAATPNAWYRLENTTSDYDKELEAHIKQYIDLLEQLKDNPLWFDKVKDEIGYQIHMIYNSLISNPKFSHLFERFDKHYFFK